MFLLSLQCIKNYQNLTRLEHIVLITEWWKTPLFCSDPVVPYSGRFVDKIDFYYQRNISNVLDSVLMQSV